MRRNNSKYLLKPTIRNNEILSIYGPQLVFCKSHIFASSSTLLANLA